MRDTTLVRSPTALHFKSSAEQCASSDDGMDYMSKVLYYSVVGSLMYAMVCSRPYLLML
jgi:ATP-binding cassette subfamily B (MDR/TAP) protein 1